MTRNIKHLRNCDSKSCLTSCKRFAQSLLALSLLAACDSQQQLPPDELRITNADASAANFSVAAPSRVRSISAIDPNNLRAVVLINGIETPLQRNSAGQFIGQVVVPAQSNVALSVEFYEIFAGQNLTLATTNQSVATDTQDTSVNISRTDYTYDSYDDDGDNVSNIVERESNTNPLDAAESPELVSITITAELPEEAVDAGLSNYSIEVSVGSTVFEVAASAGQFQNTFVVPRQEPLTIDVRVIESQSGQQLTIGSQTTQLPTVNQSQSLLFIAENYSYQFDQDSDGVSNIDELIERTDPLTPPITQGTPYTVTYTLPTEIENTATVYSTLNLNGETADLSFNDNIYTANAVAEPNDAVDIDMALFDTFAGQAVTLATFSPTITPIAGGIYVLQNFDYNHDTDNDGILNYIELNQGSDPFTAPVAQCTPSSEIFSLTMSDDAFIQNNVIFDQTIIRLDENTRVGALRYQFDPDLGTVTAASLTITVGIDEGNGLVSVYAVPDLEWNDENNRLNVPELGSPIGSLDTTWSRGQEFTFELAPFAITSDFTLFLVQESGDDFSFYSRSGSAPARLNVAVENCL